MTTTIHNDIKARLTRCALAYIEDTINEKSKQATSNKTSDKTTEEVMARNGITLEYQEKEEGKRRDGYIYVLQHGEVDATFSMNIKR